MFNGAAPSLKLPTAYMVGDTKAESLPLCIEPDKKLSVHDVMQLMRDHFEGTPLDMTQDVGGLARSCSPTAGTPWSGRWARRLMSMSAVNRRISHN
jgi:dipeptidase